MVILDLCNGGSVLPTFRARLMECCPASNIYLLVATRENETTWLCGKLGCSLFTFFLSNYLQRHAQVGRLPIWDAMRHAQTLTPVLSEFLSTNADGDSGVIPHPVMEARGQVIILTVISILPGVCVCMCMCVCVCVCVGLLVCFHAVWVCGWVSACGWIGVCMRVRVCEGPDARILHASILCKQVQYRCK